MSPWVFFDNIPELFQALSLCWEEDLFPKTVLRARGGVYGVAREGFRDLDRMSAQHGWRIAHPVEDSGSEVLLASLLGATWRYVDPLRHHEARDYNLGSAQPAYLLGARDRSEANTLLTALTREYADDVRIVPLVLQPELPFEFFWRVSAEHVPLDALRAASRTWWGPAGQSRNACVLLEWPYSFELPADFLQRVPWGAGDGYVLLSRSEPEVLIVRGSLDGARPTSWEAFGDYQPVKVLHARTMADPGKVRFPVELQLTRNFATADPREQLLRLEEEIRQREREVAVLREQFDLRANDEPEPLLLYYADDETEVPRDMRRLLLEWSDQQGSLDSVYYARLDGAGFPAGFDQLYAAVHALTTAHALGMEFSDRTAGSRLLDYVPAKGARPRFNLLPGWAPHLRMFVPHGESLSLYPRLRPGQPAAEKLASAFFEPSLSVADRRESVVLMVEGDRHRINACRLDRRVFRPLVSAFAWDCAIEVAPAGVHVSGMVHRASREELVEGIAIGFYDAVKSQGVDRLNARKAQLEAEIQAEANRMNGLNTGLLAMRDCSGQLVDITALCKVEFTGIAPYLDAFGHDVGNFRDRVRAGAGLADALASAAVQLREAAIRLAGLQGDVEKFRSQLEAWKLP